MLNNIRVMKIKQINKAFMVTLIQNNLKNKKIYKIKWQPQYPRTVKIKSKRWN